MKLAWWIWFLPVIVIFIIVFALAMPSVAALYSSGQYADAFVAYRDFALWLITAIPFVLIALRKGSLQAKTPALRQSLANAFKLFGAIAILLVIFIGYWLVKKYILG